jgi:hypothetical protein
VQVAPDTEVSGAIVVVCCADVEYIESLDQTYWLTSEQPRICTHNELCSVLRSDEWHRVKNHPAYVQF